SFGQRAQAIGTVWLSQLVIGGLPWQRTKKTKAQLLQDLAALRQRIAQLEAAAAEQRQTEAAVRDSAQRYHHMVEYSLGLICIHTLDGTLLEVNPAAAQALGYGPEEWRGRN